MPRMTLPECIETILAEKSWTQRDLAKFLGLDEDTVSAIKRGKPAKGPTEIALRALARGVELEPAS